MCVKHFRARRVVKRDVLGTARLMGWGTGPSRKCLAVTRVRMGFVQRCSSALKEGAMLAPTVAGISRRDGWGLRVMHCSLARRRYEVNKLQYQMGD